MCEEIKKEKELEIPWTPWINQHDLVNPLGFATFFSLEARFITIVSPENRFIRMIEKPRKQNR